MIRASGCNPFDVGLIPTTSSKENNMNYYNYICEACVETEKEDDKETSTPCKLSFGSKFAVIHPDVCPFSHDKIKSNWKKKDIDA